MWRVIQSGVAILGGGLAAVVVYLLLLHGAPVVADVATVEQIFPASGQAYVFRFDPALQHFETFTVPTVGANPHSLEVVPGVSSLDVWFTEPGADQIGRLIYTDTDHDFQEYPVAEGSMPLNLAADADGSSVWFTAHRGNWIGRLSVASGELVTFSVPTADSEPAGIDIAPDGSVWFAEMAADKIARLTVAQEFEEYPINATDVGAYGVVVQGNEYVWFGETRTGIVKRLKIADGRFVWTTLLGTSGYPYSLLVDDRRSYLWLTERNDNQISQVELTTLTIVNSYLITPTPNSLPTGLTALGSNQFWFSGQGSGQIGRMVYTSPANYRFEVFDLPIRGLQAMDIATDRGGCLWTVAYSPWRVFLPMTTKFQ